MYICGGLLLALAALTYSTLLTSSGSPWVCPCAPENSTCEQTVHTGDPTAPISDLMIHTGVLEMMDFTRELKNISTKEPACKSDINLVIVVHAVETHAGNDLGFKGGLPLWCRLTINESRIPQIVTDHHIQGCPLANGNSGLTVNQVDDFHDLSCVIVLLDLIIADETPAGEGEIKTVDPLACTGPYLKNLNRLRSAVLASLCRLRVAINRRGQTITDYVTRDVIPVTNLTGLRPIDRNYRDYVIFKDTENLMERLDRVYRRI